MSQAMCLSADENVAEASRRFGLSEIRTSLDCCTHAMTAPRAGPRSD